MAVVLADFKKSVNELSPIKGIHPLLVALWHDAKNDWAEAHRLAQQIETPDGAWVHAYLHRKEGDESNARYWYRHASKKFPDYSLNEEWNDIAQSLLSK